MSSTIGTNDTAMIAVNSYLLICNSISESDKQNNNLQTLVKKLSELHSPTIFSSNMPESLLAINTLTDEQYSQTKLDSPEKLEEMFNNPSKFFGLNNYQIKKLNELRNDYKLCQVNQDVEGRIKTIINYSSSDDMKNGFYKLIEELKDGQDKLIAIDEFMR